MLEKVQGFVSGSLGHFVNSFTWPSVLPAEITASLSLCSLTRLPWLFSHCSSNRSPMWNELLESTWDEFGHFSKTCEMGVRHFQWKADGLLVHYDIEWIHLGDAHLICWYSFPPIVAKWTRPKFKTNVFILFFYCPRLRTYLRNQ